MQVLADACSGADKPVCVVICHAGAAHAWACFGQSTQGGKHAAAASGMPVDVRLWSLRSMMPMMYKLLPLGGTVQEVWKVGVVLSRGYVALKTL